MSDVVIRGMEMPKDQHTITITICHDGYTVVEYRDNGLLLKEIETYKTIPLPEGHGDLIDRDAFRAENGLNAKCEHCPRNTYKCQNDMIHTKMEFCEMLDDAPVIVPTEGGTEDDGNA